MDDFGKERHTVEFVGDVQEISDDFETLRVDQAAYVFCVNKCKSVMTDWPEMPSSSRRVISGVQWSVEPAGTHETKPDQSIGEVPLRLEVEMIDQLLTLEVLCPRPSGLCDVNYSMNLESVLFFSPTEQVAP